MAFMKAKERYEKVVEFVNNSKNPVGINDIATALKIQWFQSEICVRRGYKNGDIKGINLKPITVSLINVDCDEGRYHRFI